MKLCEGLLTALIIPVFEWSAAAEEGHGGSELREHLHHLGGGVRRVRGNLLPADLPARPPGSHGLQLGL